MGKKMEHEAEPGLHGVSTAIKILIPGTPKKCLYETIGDYYRDAAKAKVFYYGTTFASTTTSAESMTAVVSVIVTTKTIEQNQNSEVGEQG